MITMAIREDKVKKADCFSELTTAMTVERKSENQRVARKQGTPLTSTDMTEAMMSGWPLGWARLYRKTRLH